jgi:hypothetical protein
MAWRTLIIITQNEKAQNGMKKLKTQLFTPSRRLKPVFSTGFLEKSRNFSKRGMGFARSLFSKVLDCSQNTR